MKKCEKTREELRETFRDNIDIAYDFIKDDYMKKFPDELWEECFAISTIRVFYMFLLTKSNTLTKTDLKYMQKKSIFNDLLDMYYDGSYENNYIGYDQMLADYIKKQKKLEKTGDMQ